MNINLKKGHNIRISGIPTGEINPVKDSAEIGIVPADFQGIKPKLVIKPGDTVKLGSPLFFDKNMPQVNYPAPAGGTVKDIVYGERRVVRKIIISTDTDEQALKQEPLSIEGASRDEIVQYLLNGNLWPLIRQRPFGKTANPADTPAAIFVSGLNTAPLAIDPAMALEGREDEFRNGMAVLRKLTGGKVHLTVKSGSEAAVFENLAGVDIHQISGPHPAGNVGIQIHHIDPLKPGTVVWTVSPQQVASIGKLFTSGQFDPTVAVSLAGPAAKSPGFLKTRIGVSLSGIAAGSEPGTGRVISGDVLTGRMAAPDGDFLGFYHSGVALLLVDEKRPFLGWASLGSSSKQYTLTNAYLKTGRKPFNFSTKLNGGVRAAVPINAWEDMLPIDILPNPLFRSILAQDIE